MVKCLKLILHQIYFEININIYISKYLISHLLYFCQKAWNSWWAEWWGKGVSITFFIAHSSSSSVFSFCAWTLFCMLCFICYSKRYAVCMCYYLHKNSWGKIIANSDAVNFSMEKRILSTLQTAVEGSFKPTASIFATSNLLLSWLFGG